MVIYGIMTKTSIGKLFAAGILPGLRRGGPALPGGAVHLLAQPRGRAGAERGGWRERFDACKDVWAVVVLFVIVMGGIYGGVFTATEGAGHRRRRRLPVRAGARRARPRVAARVLIESARTTAMLFMILVGALIFANFINYTTMPADLKASSTNYQIHPMTVIVAICVIYVVLGTAMEELSMILLTVPVFFPLVVGLGFDPVWFGILIVVVVQIGLISPPVGMNMFVVKSMLPRIATSTIFRGVTPFVVAEVVLLAVLVAFPSISLVLPRLMKL